MTAEQQWAVDADPQPAATDGRTLGSRGERTRARLLETAERVFGEHGYHDASVVKITDAAGVSQGTFYNYFTSKRDLFVELVTDLNRRLRRTMSEHAARGASRIECERLGFEGFFHFTSQHPDLYRIIRQAEFVSPEALRDHYQAIERGYVRGLRAAIDAGDIADGDPRVLAWMLMGIGEIIGMRWILWADTDQVPADVFEQMFAFIRRGLGRQP